VDDELLVEVWIADWEIQCCREPPFEGQPWNEIVGLGRSATIRRDEPPRSVRRNDDGTTTVVGVITRQMGTNEYPAVVLDAGLLRVVLYRGAEIGATYEATGHLGEDRHGEYIDSDYDAACTNHGGVVREVWRVPLLSETVAGSIVRSPGPAPGERVHRISPDIDGYSVRLEVALPALEPQ
jgi:hypothetical protein